MMEKKVRILLMVFVLAVSILACSFNASTANISSAVMARDPEAQQPTTVFTQDDIFYCVAELSNAPDDTVVKANWVAVEAEGVDPNFFIDEVELTSSSDMLQFELSNNGPWPIGKYKVDLYLNNELDQTLEFEVQ